MSNDSFQAEVLKRLKGLQGAIRALKARNTRLERRIESLEQLDLQQQLRAQDTQMRQLDDQQLVAWRYTAFVDVSQLSSSLVHFVTHGSMPAAQAAAAREFVLRGMTAALTQIAASGDPALVAEDFRTRCAQYCRQNGIDYFPKV